MQALFMLDFNGVIKSCLKKVAVNQPPFLYQGECMKKMIFIMAMFAFASSNIAQANQDDETNITQVMLKQWDKPENPLHVAPIVVAADYAMVGWTQGEKGGRALLHKHHGNWQVLLCGGDALTKTEQLTQAGLETKTANDLIKGFKQQAQQLSSQEIEKMSLFEGVVNVSPAQSHEHH